MEENPQPENIEESPEIGSSETAVEPTYDPRPLESDQSSLVRDRRQKIRSLAYSRIVLTVIALVAVFVLWGLVTALDIFTFKFSTIAYVLIITCVGYIAYWCRALYQLDSDSINQFGHVELKQTAANGGAMAAIVLGVWSVFGAMITSWSFINGIVGVVLGIWGVSSQKPRLALLGILLSLIGATLCMLQISETVSNYFLIDEEIDY